MICGHGSRHEKACASFIGLVGKLEAELAPLPVAGGFLEFARPTIAEAVERLVAKKLKRIRALPLMLTAAAHVKNDIPVILRTLARRHSVEIDMSRDFGLSPDIIRLAFGRVVEAGKNTSPDQNLLLVVGRGTNDPDANSEISKLTRILWEGTGYAWAETAYSGVTRPLTDEALERLAPFAKHQNLKNVIVYPHFIFDGILVRRIYAAADEIAERFPELRIVKADYLDSRPLLIKCALDRLSDDKSRDDMNCGMCKYREFLPGFEDQVNAPQQGHVHVDGYTHEGGHTHAHAGGHTHENPHAHENDRTHAGGRDRRD